MKRTVILVHEKFIDNDDKEIEQEVSLYIVVKAIGIAADLE